MEIFYQACEQLFRRHPTAAEPPGGAQPTMTIMTGPTTDPQFYFLRHVIDGNPQPFYSLRPWRNPTGISVQPGDVIKRQGSLTLAEARAIASNAVPLPRDGSVYGWTGGGNTITSLVLFFTTGHSDPLLPHPIFTVMPHTETPRRQWPPFTTTPYFGPWWWDHHTAGHLIDAGSHIAKTRRTVYWASTPELGSGSCAVAADIAIGGALLPRGLYIFHGTLTAQTPIPPPADILRRPGTHDLGPAFAEPQETS